MLETNCTFTGCHGTDAPPDFDSTFYDGIKAKVDSFISGTGFKFEGNAPFQYTRSVVLRQLHSLQVAEMGE